MKAKATVFVVDDDPSMLKATSRVLASAEWNVESFPSGRSFLERAPYEGLGCLVADLRMPEMNGLELQSAVADRGYKLPIIFLSGYPDVRATVQALKAGAADFLVKPFSASDLLSVIETAVSRHQEILVETSEAEEMQARWDSLTPREKEVAIGVSRGLMNKQIAAELEAAEATIKIHRGRMMAKLGADSIADLVRILGRIHTTASTLDPQ